NGESITISADSEPDLFWGMRGAGSNLAVVTEVEIGLQPLSWVYGGGLFFPGESAGDVLDALVETVRDVPDALSLSVAFIRFPPNPALPVPLQGRSICHVRVCHVGSALEAEPHLNTLRRCAPLLLDTVADLPIDRIGTVHGDPVVPAPVNCRSQVLSKFDADVAALLVSVLDDQPPYLIELRHLGGALALDPTPGNAVGHRDGVVNLFTSTYPRTPSGSGGPSQDDLIQALSPYSNGGAMVNFLQGSHVTEADVRRAYDRDSWPRLTALKTTWDPENRLRSTKNIAAYPSTDAGAG
ncbi:MAG: FAD-binding oxidoreductase, partial [Janthinobacterium lividum]